jgi:hypothetical protein
LSVSLQNKYYLLNFKWSNQSTTQLAQLIFEHKFGFIPKSTHTDIAIELLDEYATMPLTCRLQDNTLDYKKHYDIRKDYATVAVDILENEKLPIHTIMDNIEIFEEDDDMRVGLYLVDEFTHPSGLVIPTQWMPHFEVSQYLDMKLITYEDIKLQYLSRYWIDGELLSNFVPYLFDEFEPNIANRLWHHFYGAFNIKRHRENYAFITDSDEMAMSYVKDFIGSADCRLINDKRWLVEKRINERIKCDNLGLYTCILGGGRMKLLDMIDTIPQNVVLNAVRVDSIYVSYGDECKTDITHWEDTYINCDTTPVEGTYFDKLKIVPYHIEDRWNPPYRTKVDRIPKFNPIEYDFNLPVFETFQEGTDYSQHNVFIQGYAGSNKTGIAVDYYNVKKNQQNQQCKVLCYTNVALQHIISRGVEQTDGQTVANFLGWTGTCYTRATPNNFNHLIIDEYSMIDTLQWVKIGKKCKIANSSIHIFGDKYQCCPIEGEIKYDITKTQFIKELLGPNGKFLEKYSVRSSDYEPRCDAYINTIITRMIDAPNIVYLLNYLSLVMSGYGIDTLLL